MADELVPARRGGRSPSQPSTICPRPPRASAATRTPRELDLDTAGVGSVVWATGYQLDFGWVDLPLFDQSGYPCHVRGVTAYPGLYDVGLRWPHREASSVLAGVGADAAHIVEHITTRREKGVPR